MKKKITLIVISLFTVSALFAETWTVSNNPDIPGQFTQIQEAVDHASTSAGDTLLVAGSSTAYNAFTLNEPFVIIGAGINNPYGQNTMIANYTVTLATISGFTPSGTRISGIYFDSYVHLDAGTGTQTIENVVFERCWFDSYLSFIGTTGAVFRHDTIRNCVLEDYEFELPNSDVLDTIVIHNNLFDNCVFDDYGTGADMSKVFVMNNVFIDETTNIFDGMNNMDIRDNIFFEANPQGCVGCNFQNNTSYGAADNTLPGAGNSGSGNEVRDPKFVNYTIADASFTFGAGYDFNLMPESLDDDSGTGGDERGMYGGLMPVELGTNPAIPQMTEISFPDNASSVEEGGTLNVRFKAKKQD